ALAFHFLEALMNASLEELVQVDEIGERIGRSIISYFSDTENRALVERLKAFGVQTSVSEERLSGRSDKL
ncbi:NAD-dependent DNA ligase LigA, partial [[Clostridium] symbiosum]